LLKTVLNTLIFESNGYDWMPYETLRLIISICETRINIIA
jgi:hypothetical protein